MGKLVLLFTVVPLVELWLLLFVGDLLGLWPTVAIVLVTGVVGAWLARSEGLRVFRRWRDAVTAGHLPEEGVLSGLLVLVGGVLLVTPGVLTDFTGLLLLIPPTRRLVAEVIRRRLERGLDEGSVRVMSYRMDVGGGLPFDPAAGGRAARGDVIDVQGEVVEVSRGVGPGRQLPS